MSRSRHPRKRRFAKRTLSERFPHHADWWLDMSTARELRFAPPSARELQAGITEARDVPDGDYASRRAAVLAVEDAAETYHHGRRLNQMERIYRRSRRRLIKLIGMTASGPLDAPPRHASNEEIMLRLGYRPQVVGSGRVWVEITIVGYDDLPGKKPGCGH